MAKTIAQTVYTFAELPAKTQARIVAKHREYAAQDFDPDYLYDDVIEVCARLGITLAGGIEGIRWSGFYSQGDGASLIGTMELTPGAEGRIAAHAPEDAELHRIARVLDDLIARYPLGVRAMMIPDHYARYVHERSVTIETETGEDGAEDVAPLPEPAREELDEALRDLMRWVYRQIKTEYDYRTSDATIREALTEDTETHYDMRGRVVDLPAEGE